MTKEITGHKADVTANGKHVKGCLDYTCYIHCSGGMVTLSCLTHEYEKGDRLALDAVIDLVLTDWIGQSLSYKTRVTSITQFENVKDVPYIVYKLTILTEDEQCQLTD